MFKVPVAYDVIEHCESQVEEFDFGARYTANGTKEQQLTGIIGQSVVMGLFGLDYVDGSDGFDNGIDIEYSGTKIDVKTMGRTTDVRMNYTNNFLKLQDCFDPDVYIFCSYNKITRELTVCGWIDKQTFQRRRRFHPRGSLRRRSDGTTFTTFADLYEIDMVHLQDVSDPMDLKRQIQEINPSTT